MEKQKGMKNVIKKLEQSINNGDFYEAQQMYKTLYFRLTGQKKYHEVVELLLNGAINMLNHQRFNEGTELSLLLINVYNETKAKVNPQTLEPILKIFSIYSNFLSNTSISVNDITYNQNNEDENMEDINSSSSSSSFKNAFVAMESFMKAAIKWSSSNGDNKEGEPQLYLLVARIFSKIGDYGKAQKYFLRSAVPKEFASMLTEWSLKANPSERDLFIARAVLQYLAIGNLKDANIVFEEFLSLMDKNPQYEQKSFPRTPLINYIRFLLMTLERDAYPLFDMLRKKYAPSINRDIVFQEFLDQIAQIFFNVKTSSGNIFSELLKSFFSPQIQ
jgi:tetratricopeptide (TPR) repeat protein